VGVAKQLGIMDKITFLGNHANIEQILPCADLILQPSEHESFGLVALEAMSCEIPVVATAAGGTTEVVEHAITGFLCEVGDIDAMAGYAACVLNDPEHAAALGRAGRVRALQCFPRDKMLREYEELYMRLCS
jgi:glycosyltransferase involved in cell wall biosynthesis